MWSPLENPAEQSSNPMEDSGSTRHRRTRSANLLSCCCFGSEDAGPERSLLRTSWLQKIRRSNSGPESSDGDSHNWLRRGWHSVRRAGEWSESMVEDYAGGCCSGPKWKHFVRRFKADGKTIYSSRPGPARFHYDPLSYELNFDDGSRTEGDYQGSGLSARIPFPVPKPRETPA